MFNAQKFLEAKRKENRTRSRSRGAFLSLELIFFLAAVAIIVFLFLDGPQKVLGFVKDTRFEMRTKGVADQVQTISAKEELTYGSISGADFKELLGDGYTDAAAADLAGFTSAAATTAQAGLDTANLVEKDKVIYGWAASTGTLTSFDTDRDKVMTIDFPEGESASEGIKTSVKDAK